MKIFRKLVLIFIGSILFSLGLEAFLVPNQIIDGGIIGISIILSHLLEWNLGIVLFILNLPFLVIGYKTIGRSFALYTLYAVSIMSLGTIFFHHLEPVTSNPLLAAIFGGIIMGIGVGLVIRFGGSLDGTEIVAIVLSSNKPISVGEVVLFFNIFILGSSGFVFGWENAMFSMISYFVIFKMIDLVIEGLDETRSIMIISNQSEEIASAILTKLGRGVTYLHGEGAYTNDKKKIIFCVITRLEEAQLKSIVENIDPECFITIGHIHEVKGGRFKSKK